ncbi:hypothetical protein OG978_32630 [Streptomyces sp. NBC_01591]|uniref:hypothetical protein n=1 Tax=Streptomyces sp. NBC_01591 TaxID=2975888 RepID=UPI002DD7AF81|nr:hypothetical protein [Streptomyces sp. NBC_01591]WSD71720.1 hypothetical protein OG978_32630 [Streptomyces sp. NBC_01591]
MEATTRQHLTAMAQALTLSCNQMTEAARIRLAGEITGHRQDEVDAVLGEAPAVPPYSTCRAYAQLLLDTANGGLMEAC